MARYKLAEVFAFLRSQNCEPTGDLISAGIAFQTADGLGFILPVYDPEWIDANLVDEILANRWIVSCSHSLQRYE